MKMDRNLHYPEAHSKVSQTSKMEFCAKVINNFSAVDYFRKRIHFRCLTDFWMRLFNVIQKFQLLIIVIMMPKTFMFDYFFMMKKEIQQETLLIFFLWYGKTRVTSYELRVASYELRVTSWKLKSMS